MKYSLKEPIQIKIKAHVDDRGVLWQIFKEEIYLKRIYVIRNHKAGIIRGFHLHRKETKMYFIAAGVAKFIIDHELYEVPKVYILSDKDPSILIIPPNYLHGWISIIDNTVLIGMSDKTLEESKDDDYRIDPFKFGHEIWETHPR